MLLACDEYAFVLYLSRCPQLNDDRSVKRPHKNSKTTFVQQLYQYSTALKCIDFVLFDGFYFAFKWMKSLLYGDHYTEDGKQHLLFALFEQASSLLYYLCISCYGIGSIGGILQIPNWTCVHDESKYWLLTYTLPVFLGHW